MGQAKTGLNDLLEFMSRPLFTLGGTGISISRILITAALIPEPRWRVSYRCKLPAAAHRGLEAAYYDWRAAPELRDDGKLGRRAMDGRSRTRE
jgi:hypothetical protein